MKKQTTSVQQWLPFEKILENGIIQLKNKQYIKIIEVIPINYSLKTDLEKEAILNSYKLFLKTCNFDIQILIQSNKIDLSNNIQKLKKYLSKKENEPMLNIYENYINFIQNINEQNKSASKKFLILIKEIPEEQENENFIISNLNEKYYKIKECLSRCGNITYDIPTKQQIIKILYSFYNYRKYLNNY